LSQRLEQQYKVAKPRLKAAFYAGCVIDFVYPEIGAAIYKVLDRHGVQLTFPQGQACCGAPAIYAGDDETAVKLAKINIAALEEANADIIVTACPTCAVALKKDFVELLAADPAWHKRAQILAGKVKDCTELVYELSAGQAEQVARAGSKEKVTYHDSCHFKRHMGLDQVARQVLQSQPGIELVEMKDCDRCCGFAGSYNVKYPQISAPILKRKLNSIIESGAQVVSMDCPGCIVQIRGGLDQLNSPIKVKHTVEILAAELK
jgi:Fe-S oxidoreductase